MSIFTSLVSFSFLVIGGYSRSFWFIAVHEMVPVRNYFNPVHIYSFSSEFYSRSPIFSHKKPDIGMNPVSGFLSLYSTVSDMEVINQ